MKKKLISISLSLSIIMSGISPAAANVSADDLLISPGQYSSEPAGTDGYADVVQPQTDPSQGSNMLITDQYMPDNTYTGGDIISTSQGATGQMAAQDVIADEGQNADNQVSDAVSQDVFSKTVLTEAAIQAAPDETAFVSMRILVGTDRADMIPDPENIISQYNGMYVLQYETVTEARNAYAWYSAMADIVAPDISMQAAEYVDYADTEAGEGVILDEIQAPGGSTQTISDEIETIDPLGQLETQLQADEEADAQPESAPEDFSRAIALIDTGVTGHPNVVKYVSMLGDDTRDDNGHGNLMAQYICEENPGAEIISIKALDSNGTGTVSTVYSAIQYAIEKHVAVINLSMSAFSREENAIIRDIIAEAVRCGITVVGSAGNDGKNVKYYIPGSVEDAVVIGACDAQGNPAANSNYGDTVDYYLAAGSTSEAAARYSGIISGHAQEDIDANILGQRLFKGDGSTIGTGTGIPQEEDDGLFNAALNGENDTINYYRNYNDSDNTIAKTLTRLNLDGWSGTTTDSLTKTGYVLLGYFTERSGGTKVYTPALAMDHRISTQNIIDGFGADYTVARNTAVAFTGGRDVVGGEYWKYIDNTSVYDSMPGWSSNRYHWLPYNRVVSSGGYLASDGLRYQTAKKVSYYNLYAQWRELEHTVNLDVNGGTLPAGAWTSATKKYSDPTLNLPTPTRTGYHFDGWKITANTGVNTDIFAAELWEPMNYTPYMPDTLFTGTGYTNEQDGGTVTMTAQWTPNPVVVTYNGNQGAVPGSGDTTFTVNDVYDATHTVQANPFERADYTFTGWNTSADGTGTSYAPAATFTLTEDVTLYAQWSKNSAVITFHANGGTGTMNPQTVQAGVSETLQANAFTRDGYDFEGWAESAAGPAEYGDGDSIATTTNMELFAIWTPKNYIIRYITNGGNQPAGQIYSYNVLSSEAERTILDLPDTGSATFLGWTGSNGATPQKSVVIPAGTTGDLTYTANWQGKTGSFIDEATAGTTNLRPILDATDMNEGKFLIVETQSAPGYIYERQEQEVDVERDAVDGVITVTFFNTPNKPQIQKTDLTGNALEGAEFNVWHDSTSESAAQTYVSGSDGYLVNKETGLPLSRLAPGLWHYRETLAPAGYEADTTRYDFRISDTSDVEGGNSRAVLNPVEEPYNYISIYKVDDDGMPLSNVEFELKYPGGSVKSGTTNPSGYAIFNENITPGNYQYREVTELPGYQQDHSWHSITLAADGTVNGSRVITVVNHKNKFTLKKVDEKGNPVSDVIFYINQPNGSTLERRTDANGEITISALMPGAWTIKEISAKKGYVLANQPYSITVNNDATIQAQAAENVQVDGSGTFSVTWTLTNNPNHTMLTKNGENGEPLAGVKFHVWKENGGSGSIDGIYTTDSNGHISNAEEVFGNSATNEQKRYMWKLEPGTYHYVETETLPGYILDKTDRTFVVSSNGQIQESEIVLQNKKNQVTLQKINSAGEPVKNVEFTFTSGAGATSIGKKNTNDAGQIVLDALYPGTYSFRETNAPDEYVMDTHEYSFTVTSGGDIVTGDPELSIAKTETGIAVFTITNVKKPGANITIKKVNDKNEPITVAAEFKLYAWDGTAYSVNAGTATHAGGGLYTFDTVFVTSANAGKFKVVETKNPDGYTGTYEKEILINHNEDVVNLTYTAKNPPNKVRIEKVDADNPSLKLGGAVFEVWKEGQAAVEYTTLTKDSTDPDGPKKGQIEMTTLAPGTYYYKEKTAPEGYLLNDEQHTFVVDENNLINGAAEFSFTATNKKKSDKTASVLIKKYNHKHEPLTGAEFSVFEYDSASGQYSAAPIMDGVNSVISYNAEKGIYETTKELQVTEENLGRFKVVETKAPDGHYGPWESTFEVDDMGAPNQLFRFDEVINNPVTFEVLKVDENDQPLKGAEFTLVSSQNTYSETSGSDGIAKFEAVKNGVYTLTETKAPEGHVANDPGHTIVVEDGYVYEQGDEAHKARSYQIKIENPESSGNLLKILKLDYDTLEPIEGVTFTIWNVNNQEGTSEVLSTDEDGYAKKSNLSPGEYCLQETSAPEPYFVPTTLYHIHVESDRKIWSDFSTNAGRELIHEFTLKNADKSRYGKITLKKVDPENPQAELAGAKFDIYEYNAQAGRFNTKPCAGMEYSESGRYNSPELLITDENAGKFLVKETVPPIGYSGSFEQEVTFPSSGSGVKEVDIGNVPNPKQKIRTLAWDIAEGKHTGAVKTNATVKDKVSFYNLVVGETYTFSGRLVDKATGNDILDAGGDPITATQEYTATQANGDVTLTFNLDSSQLEGKSVLVYEYLYNSEGVMIAEHAENEPPTYDEFAVTSDGIEGVASENSFAWDGSYAAEDNKQTVNYPKVRTSASDVASGTSMGTLSETAKIKDHVTLTNLTVGEKYKVQGKLMDKETETALKIGGNEITASSSEFTATAASMTVDLAFTLDTTGLKGKSIVVFEDLLSESVVVASHKDINDTDQTIDFPAPPKKEVDKMDNNLFEATHTWTVTQTIPSSFASMEAAARSFKIEDTLDTRLKWDSLTSLTIKDSTATLTKGTDYTVTEPTGSAGGILVITATASGLTKLAANSGKDIVLKFKTVLNDNATPLDVAAKEDKTFEENDNENLIPNKAKVTIAGIANWTDEPFVYTADIEITKVDAGGTKLAGAKFKLQKSDGTDFMRNNALYEVTTDANGKASFTGLENGTYYIVETKAPAGKQLLGKKVPVVIEKGIVTKVDGRSVDAENRMITITDNGKIHLHSGGIGTHWFYIGGAVILFAIAAVLLASKRKGKNNR